MNNRETGMSRRQKVFLNFIFVIIIFPLFINVIQAQEVNSESRLVQRLSWTSDDFALRFEVLIERSENNRYTQAAHNFTDQLFIDVSLSPGNYRIQVTPYNFRDMPGEKTEWKYFTVLAVQQPELTPESLTAPALTQPAETASAPVHEPAQAQTAEQQSALPTAETAQVVELEDEPPQTEIIKEKQPRPFNQFLNITWMPLFPLFESEGLFFDDNLSLMGAGLRYGLLFEKQMMSLNPGFELAASWYSANSLHETIDEKINVIGIGVNLLFEKTYPSQKVAIIYRLGAGTNILFGTETDDSLYTALRLTVNTGISFKFKITDRTNIVTGLDYSHYFTNIASGCFRPWLGIGFQF